MISPEFIQDLNDRPSEELRLIIAHCTSIHAHRDGDNGQAIARSLARIAARITLQAREAA